MARRAGSGLDAQRVKIQAVTSRTKSNEQRCPRRDSNPQNVRKELVWETRFPTSPTRSDARCLRNPELTPPRAAFLADLARECSLEAGSNAPFRCRLSFSVPFPLGDWGLAPAEGFEPSSPRSTAGCLTLGHAETAVERARARSAAFEIDVEFSKDEPANGHTFPCRAAS